jgi:hypothetical protein
MVSPTEAGRDALIWGWAVIPPDISVPSIICCGRGLVYRNFSSIGYVTCDLLGWPETDLQQNCESCQTVSDAGCVIPLATILSCLRRRREFIVAWTEMTRRKYRRDGLRYASDTTDGERAVIEPHMPLPAAGRPRETISPKPAAYGASGPAIFRRSPRFSCVALLGAIRDVGRPSAARC